MKRISLVLLVSLLTLHAWSQTYTGNATFTYDLGNADCPITVTVYHSISGGVKPKIVTFSHTYTIGETYSFPNPLLNSGESISSTSFNFCSSQGCYLEAKSNLDGQTFHMIGFQPFCLPSGCYLLTDDLGNNAYKMHVDCFTGG